MAARVRLLLIAAPPGAHRTEVVNDAVASLVATRSGPVSLILEGARQDAGLEPAAGAGGRRHLLAGGCPCCIGALPLRVTLARILHLEQPGAVILTVSDPSHLGTLSEHFRAPPWSERIALDP